MLVIVLVTVFASAFAAPLVEDRVLKLVDPIDVFYEDDVGKLLIIHKNRNVLTN